MTSKTPTPTLDNDLLSLLVESGVMTEEGLRTLTSRSKGEQSIFERLLLNEGYLIDNQLGQLKAQVHGWHFVDLETMDIAEQELSALPTVMREAQGVVPYRYNSELRIAMKNPADTKLVRLLRKKFGASVSIAYATDADISEALASNNAEYAEHCELVLKRHLEASKQQKTDDNSIIELVDSLLLHGVRSRASDIHIEPRREESIVRERVDGVLGTTLRFAPSVHDLVCLRIKVLANLATDEHSKPQDGKLQYITPGGKRVDVRVSISPITSGEKIVMRLLAPEDQALSMEAIGLQPEDLHRLQKEMGRSWGMVLVTGPTGSGKTTTLYSGVRKLNQDSVNIATIEDPVEYDLPGVNQIQVNEKAGITFANGLRSIVRQDPNIILVGEIRDSETAGIGVNAAMTGHLVLSTLHTNDAATALPRLIDMGIEPFLISSTVNVIIAQRLVRNTCSRCRESREVSVSELKESVPADLLKKLANGKKKIRLYEGKGCSVCDGSGYHGRSGIFELLIVDKSIQDLIMKNADADTIKQAAVKNGMRTMIEDGISKVLQGVTTLEEVLRVIRS
ncbi:MAG: Flp pilus assembly complex ATPase component TadA [Candidatus Peregrinibacteria bacterium]|nr:Flp pilus assembly complex ATPase component TadA [Candidatus Peregrinibacteria bacterium]MCB9808252.1 Flp pilus assembly complex ATPase component TadA [Candidatus Peribacteria bacterium]